VDFERYRDLTTGGGFHGVRMWWFKMIILPSLATLIGLMGALLYFSGACLARNSQVGKCARAPERPSSPR
jgi:hypothetical protein